MNFKNVISLSALSVVTSVSGQIADVDFSAASDYDNNFVVLTGAGTNYSEPGGYLYRQDIGGGYAMMYNSGATGGSAGSGGTAFGASRDLFGGSFSVSIDYSAESRWDGSSIGIYSKVPDANNAGYAGLFRILPDGNADFRLFDSNSNANTAGVGTLIGSQSYNGGSLAADTFYTFVLDIVDGASEVTFTGSIYEQGGALIHEFGSIADTTSPVLGEGQIGMRLSSFGGGFGGAEHYRIDNFTVTVPEPSVYALILGVFGMGIACRIRRRRIG